MAEPRGKDKNTESVDNKVEKVNTLTFDEKVIKKIVGFSAGEIPGILAMSGNLISGLTDMLKSADDPTKGISVEMGKKQVAVDLKVICEYGRNIPEVFRQIVDEISLSMQEMTGLEVVEVNVHVADILPKEEFERKKKTAAKAESEAEAGEDTDRRRVE